jgi:hypothetical protein
MRKQIKKQTRKTMSVWVAAVVVLASASSLAAHHSLADFDTTTAVRVKGTIFRIDLINPHSIIFVDQKGAAGQMQRWAMEGPGVRQLAGMGFDKDSLKAGDTIEACGYVTRNGVDYKRTVSIEPVSLTPNTVTGRLMDAELLVMPGGQTQRWSDYGHHLCLAPDYHDFHK